MEQKIKLFTMGYTKKTAEQFFSILEQSGVRRVIDVRLNNVSQLAAFTKKDDLKYFLHRLCGIDYLHKTDLAPTEEILKKYKSKQIDWSEYESLFKSLLRRRCPALTIDELDHGCLLCSEPQATNCHRRLVAEYFQQMYPQIQICHL